MGTRITEVPDGATTADLPRVALLGASAGGVEALLSVARHLPPDARLAVAAVLHMPTGAASRLPEIIARAGPLPATRATHAAPLMPGRIVVAPPDHHLVIEAGRTYLLDGPKENGFRPSIDALFRSAARTLGAKSIGVILSGTLDDGIAGMAAIQASGGTTIVQDPGDALVGGLPAAALQALEPDHVAKASQIGALLGDLAAAAPTARAASSAAAALLADPADLPATGVDLNCPDCDGALQAVETGPLTRYRCRVGHTYSAESLLDGKSNALEAALWTAVRTLEESAMISQRLAERSRRTGASAAARRFEARQANAARRADLVRQAIESFDLSADEAPEEALAATRS